MALPFSKTQIEKLGIRLVGADPPDPSDLAMLQSLLSVYSEILTTAISRVAHAIGSAPTARVKNTGTILEKLERQGGSWLKSIQDLAGMRIVADVDRTGQDRLVQQVVDVFADEARVPRVIDRRESPSYGYTAVHVVVFPEGVPVEVQIRTRLQHEWAEMFEKLADRVGRAIRYGGPPDHWLDLKELQEDQWKELYVLSYKHREAIAEMAVALGEFIGAFEQVELDLSVERIQEYQRNIDEGLVKLRADIEHFSQPDVD